METAIRELGELAQCRRQKETEGVKREEVLCRRIHPSGGDHRTYHTPSTTDPNLQWWGFSSETRSILAHRGSACSPLTVDVSQAVDARPQPRTPRGQQQVAGRGRRASDQIGAGGRLCPAAPFDAPFTLATHAPIAACSSPSHPPQRRAIPSRPSLPPTSTRPHPLLPARHAGRSRHIAAAETKRTAGGERVLAGRRGRPAEPTGAGPAPI